MLFDTHVHPYIYFKKSGAENLQNFFNAWGKYLISVGCDIKSSLLSIELAQQYSGVYASIGFHPCDIPMWAEKTSLNSLLQGEMKQLRDLYTQQKKHIVAIGEIGLDYYHLATLSEKSWYSHSEIISWQKDFFRAQIRLAKELSLPFIIHSRESNEEVLEILEQENARNYVFHCYSGDWDLAQRILQQNPQAKFGFGWTLTFKKSTDLREVAQNLPLKHILIETDAPFLTPEPLRGKEENEPIFTKYVLDSLQDIRNEAPEEVENTIFENSKKFFWI